jgi:hypothetical protein
MSTLTSSLILITTFLLLGRSVAYAVKPMVVDKDQPVVLSTVFESSNSTSLPLFLVSHLPKTTSVTSSEWSDHKKGCSLKKQQAKVMLWMGSPMDPISQSALKNDNTVPKKPVPEKDKK